MSHQRNRQIDRKRVRFQNFQNPKQRNLKRRLVVLLKRMDDFISSQYPHDIRVLPSRNLNPLPLPAPPMAGGRNPELESESQLPSN